MSQRNAISSDVAAFTHFWAMPHGRYQYVASAQWYNFKVLSSTRAIRCRNPTPIQSLRAVLHCSTPPRFVSWLLVRCARVSSSCMVSAHRVVGHCDLDVVQRSCDDASHRQRPCGITRCWPLVRCAVLPPFQGTMWHVILIYLCTTTRRHVPP